MKFGVVLPHFGEQVSKGLLLDSAKAAEAAGYSIAWARDHMNYQPHVWEPPGSTFLEQYISLASVASVTESIELGAGATIPFRPPRHVRMLAESLAILSERRVHIGLGLGDYAAELADAGVTGESVSQRRRRTFAELKGSALFAGRNGALRLWWAGAGAKSAEIAGKREVDWLAGRQLIGNLSQRMCELAEFEKANGWRPRVAIWLIVNFSSQVKGPRDNFPLMMLSRFAKGGAIEAGSAIDQVRGSVLTGDVEEIAADLKALRVLGVDVAVLDFRFSPKEEFIADMVGFLKEFEH